MASGGDTAGASAEGRADQLRAKAEQLKAEAERYERGAAGERVTASLLASLPPGWLVRHDLSIPSSKANIDHVAIGPPGVFVIDTKNWRYPARVSGGTLWCSRYPKGQVLETVAWEMEKVAEAVSGGVPVFALLCLLGPVDGALGAAGTVNVLHGAALVDYLIHQPPVLGPDAVLQSADLIDRALSGKVPGSASQTTLLSRTPAAAPSHPSVRGEVGSQGTASSGRRRAARFPTAPSRPKRQRRRRGNGVAGAIAPLIACVVLVLAAPKLTPMLTWLGDRFGDHLTERLPKTTTPTTISAGTAKAALTPLQVQGWSCPAAGAGWSASLAFDTGGTTWAIQTGATPAGPWHYATTGTGAAPQAINGIKSGVLFYARAGSIMTLNASPASVPVVPITPPTTTC